MTNNTKENILIHSGAFPQRTKGKGWTSHTRRLYPWIYKLVSNVNILVARCFYCHQANPYPPPFTKSSKKKKKKKKKKKMTRAAIYLSDNVNKRPMGHNSLTYIFANVCNSFPSLAQQLGYKFDHTIKKVKDYPSLIILTNLVDLESPIPYTKIQSQSFLSTGEEDFKCFYHIWAWPPSCSMMQNLLKKVSTSLRQKAPCEMW